MKNFIGYVSVSGQKLYPLDIFPSKNEAGEFTFLWREYKYGNRNRETNIFRIERDQLNEYKIVWSKDECLNG